MSGSDGLIGMGPSVGRSSLSHKSSVDYKSGLHLICNYIVYMYVILIRRNNSSESLPFLKKAANWYMYMYIVIREIVHVPVYNKHTHVIIMCHKLCVYSDLIKLKHQIHVLLQYLLV